MPEANSGRALAGASLMRYYRGRDDHGDSRLVFAHSLASILLLIVCTNSIEILREVLRVAGMTPEELWQELAGCLFQQGKPSFGKAREVAGMTAWAFQQLLGGRGIPVHYDVEDYEQDLKT